MTYKVKTISYDTRVRFFWTLVAISILALGVYFYALQMTTRNTATRHMLENEVAEQATQLSVLEFEYITRKQEVNLTLAHEYGFKEVRTPLFVSRARAGVLTMHVVTQ